MFEIFRYRSKWQQWWDFSLVSLTQNDKVLMTNVWIFLLWFAPCKPILHFLATAQNSKFKILLEFLHKIGVNLGQIHTVFCFDTIECKNLVKLLVVLRHHRVWNPSQTLALYPKSACLVDKFSPQLAKIHANSLKTPAYTYIKCPPGSIDIAWSGKGINMRNADIFAVFFVKNIIHAEFKRECFVPRDCRV